MHLGAIPRHRIRTTGTRAQDRWARIRARHRRHHTKSQLHTMALPHRRRPTARLHLTIKRQPSHTLHLRDNKVHPPTRPLQGNTREDTPDNRILTASPKEPRMVVVMDIRNRNRTAHRRRPSPHTARLSNTRHRSMLTTQDTAVRLSISKGQTTIRAILHMPTASSLRRADLRPTVIPDILDNGSLFMVWKNTM